jgi:hypothetical protein
LEGSSLDNGTILLRESSSCMDVLEVLALGMTGSRRGGGLGQGLLKFLEFRGRRGSVSRLASLLAVVIDTLDVSLMEMTPCGPGIFKIK